MTLDAKVEVTVGHAVIVTSKVRNIQFFLDDLDSSTDMETSGVCSCDDWRWIPRLRSLKVVPPPEVLEAVTLAKSDFAVDVLLLNSSLESRSRLKFSMSPAPAKSGKKTLKFMSYQVIFFVGPIDIYKTI